MPIVVSTLLPSFRAHRLAPLPRWSTTILPHGRSVCSLASTRKAVSKQAMSRASARRSEADPSGNIAPGLSSCLGYSRRRADEDPRDQAFLQRLEASSNDIGSYRMD